MLQSGAIFALGITKRFRVNEHGFCGVGGLSVNYFRSYAFSVESFAHIFVT